MDLGTTIFVAIMVLACVIPVAIVNRKKKNKEKLFLKAMTEFALNSKCKIMEYDLWNNSGIGIDKEARRVFLIRRTQNGEVMKEINLAETQKCRVLNSNRAVINNNSNQIVTERLELAFVNRDKNKSDEIIEFYNSATDRLYLCGEIQLTEKWAGIINSVISGGNMKS